MKDEIFTNAFTYLKRFLINDYIKRFKVKKLTYLIIN